MNLVEGSSVKVVDLARVPEGIAYPSYKKLTLIGCVIGVGLTLAIIVLLVLFNSYIEDEDDIAKLFDAPASARYRISLSMTTTAKERKASFRRKGARLNEAYQKKE